MAFLTVIKNVVAQFRHLFEREHIVMDFSFLQADNVRLMLFHQRGKLMRAGAQAIDVKRDEFHSREHTG